jgi:tetratricopeptide (TPR) repeat protein
MREDQIAEIRRFGDFLNEGHAEARAGTRELLALPPAEWDAWLAAHPQARTHALCKALLEEAERGAGPEVTELVTRLAETAAPAPVSPELIQALLSAHAWTAHARALHAAERLEECMRAYETAMAIRRAWPVMAFRLAELEKEAALARVALDPAQALGELSPQIAAGMDRAPLEALRLAEHVKEIVEAFPPDRYPPRDRVQWQVRAWRDHAVALQALARYREALDELQRAEELLSPFDGMGYMRGLVRFARAVTLQEAGRYDEAAETLAESRQLLDAHGDSRARLGVRIAEGGLLYRTGKLDAARASWEAALPAAEAAGDAHAVASLHNNLAYVLIDLGEWDAAEAHTAVAIRRFIQLGAPVQTLRSELARGRILLKQGAAEKGIAHLRRVRAQFLEHGLVEEGGLCGLEIVAADLERGSAREAEALAREIICQFTAAELNRRAITAVDYLSDAIAARKALPATADHVRRFIQTLRRNPKARFRATA